MKSALSIAFLLLGSLSLHAGQVTIKGSDTMVILCQKWAEAYMRQNPDTNIQVTGGGSGTGVAALMNGTTDIASCSRTMKPKEEADFVVKNAVRATETKVALDGLAIYVNDGNPMKDISLSQLEGIFTGKVTNWKELGGRDEKIVLYSRENNSGTYAYFKEHVLKEKDFSPAAQALPGTAALINAVAKDEGGIGYGGIAYASGVKVLPVKPSDDGAAVAPTMENVLSSKYPISRYLFFYTNPKGVSPETKAFLDWVQSDPGQKLVENVGYYPLPKVQAVAAAAPAPAEAAARIAVAPPSAPSAPADAPVPAVKREEILAVRETQLAQRETQLAEREKTLAQREKMMAEREALMTGAKQP